MLYIVTYDLRTPKRDYEGLYEQLKNSSSWWHYLESSWLIDTTESAEDIFNRLRAHIDNNDFILIIRVGKDRHGWLPKKAWEWIQEHEG